MYDGIKIKCQVTNTAKFEKALGLIGRFDEQTGAVLPLPSECTRRAVTFSKIPGPTGYKYNMQGSLHRFFNKGAENDNDYTITEVKQTIAELQETLSINPKRSKVINFEFGVNITLPDGMDAQVFQKYLVSAQFKAFEKLNPRRPAVGYIAEFNEFNIKIYDKGYQAQTGATNLLRVEIKVNRTRWLDQYGFIKGKDLYVTDLLNKTNIRILGDILQNKIRSLILTPRTLDISQLSPKQKQTFYECRDARSWEEWTSRQRERKRAQLAAIFKKLNQPDPVDALAKLVNAKWLDVTKETAPVQNSREKVTFSSLIVGGIRAFLDLFKKHEKHFTNTVYSFIIYLPRGKPVQQGTGPPAAIKGFNRWIDLRNKGPPI